MEPTASSPTSPGAGAGSRDMPGTRGNAAAKLCVLLGFLVLLSSSYYLRTEVLELNRIRFSADEARANYELKRLRESYPERIERHQVELKNHDLQLEHYQNLSEFYRNCIVKYVYMI